MRNFLILVGFIMSCGAFADGSERNVAGKLTALKKPPVRIMTEDERVVASQAAVALDLDADPDQIVCRKVRVGSGSRIKANRCKTRAEFREEDERELAVIGRELDDLGRRFATRQSALARQESNLERRHRIRIR